MTCPLSIWPYIWSNQLAKICCVPYFNSFKNVVIQLVFQSKMPEHYLCFAGLYYAFRQGTPCAVHHLRGTMNAPGDVSDLEDCH